MSRVVGPELLKKDPRPLRRNTRQQLVRELCEGFQIQVRSTSTPRVRHEALQIWTFAKL